MTTIDTHVSSAPATSGSGLACVAEWLTTTDHKRIGRLYIGTGALAFLASAVVALLLGIERISPTREMLDVNSLTQLFSLQRFGLTYLALVPLLLGVALAIVPLQVGSRSLAFPRLASAGFWAWFIGALLAVWALANNGGPNGGNPRFVDLFILSVALIAAGLLFGAVSLVTTILTTRAPGMNMRRVPFFTWSALVSSLGLLIALPVLVGNLVYVYVGHHYASVGDLSGNRAVGQWAAFAFTQPTTILFTIPVFGLLAETVATSTRQRLQPRGIIYAGIALVGVASFGTMLQWPATLRPGFLDASFGEKVNDLLPFAMVHLLPLLGAFIAVSLSLKGLTAKPKISTPLVFALFAGLLAFGGVAASALNHIGDAGLIGTTFEEGTWLALVFSGVLATMGAVAYWGPKWWGRSLPMKASLPLALLAFAGAGVSALSLMIAGFADQPGGVFPAVRMGDDAVVNFDYSGPMGLWNTLNVVGIGLVLVSVLAFVALALRSFAPSLTTGGATGDDPWDGQTLEWATTSPAPAHNFAEVHIVRSAEPLLDLKPSNRSDA